MKFCVVFLLSAFAFTNSIAYILTEDEVIEVSETCCPIGESMGMLAIDAAGCSGIPPPEDMEPEKIETCLGVAKSCCEEHIQQKKECAEGIQYSIEKLCYVPNSDAAKTCCEECSLGRWTGESQGREACGSPSTDDVSPSTAMRKQAFYKCCVEAVATESTTKREPETAPEENNPTDKCKPDTCEHICNDDSGKVKCQCNYGYRLQADKRSCKDINECNEAIDNLCDKEGTVCQNLPGSFQCVPIKKRDVGSCPAGFKKNTINQVCDDINECQLPRPPCPKYLCENTIGGYKCAGKAGKPTVEGAEVTPEAPRPNPEPEKSDNICPPGFRAGPESDCVDIDECDERLDDCQRLSQHCINTHGNFFCQDHVSKRCYPGFKVNPATGICEDIDECKEGTEVCQRNEVCVNLPGAYNCKSKISTLPKLNKKTNCQEGTRLSPGGSTCEDINECREGTHLCDQFQNCINTYGGHECRCKSGFELDSTTSSCVDVDECAMKIDNCGPGRHCLNVLGSYTCTRQPTVTTSSTSTTTTTPQPEYEYYYDSVEDNSTSDTSKPRQNTPTSIKPEQNTQPTIVYNNPDRLPANSGTTLPNKPPERRPTYRPNEEKPGPREEPHRNPENNLNNRHNDTNRRPYDPYNRPDSNRRPYNSYNRPNNTNRKPEDSVRKPEITEVIVPKPNNAVVIEKDKDPKYGFEIDTNEIPKNTWTNIIGKDKPKNPEEDFDVGNLNCLPGYEKNSKGECIDIDECLGNRHICSSLEVCQNTPGRYTCECIPGFRRESSGDCVVITYTTPSRPAVTSTTTSSTTTSSTTTSSTTTSSTTSSTTESTAVSRIPVRPYIPPRPRPPTFSPAPAADRCDFGYRFDSNIGSYGRCVDIDECTENTSSCAANEDCINVPGGYKCICGSRCYSGNRPSYPQAVAPRPQRPGPDSNVITVGAQYGDRGPKYMRPNYQHLSNSILSSCPWGYKLTANKQCVDIDECGSNTSQCGPEQRCENFYGGYSCNCPNGYKLVGQATCEDIDECTYGHPCSYNAKCINTPGSFRCACGEGFQNAPSNDKVCVDVDECVTTPGVCDHSCANAWGGYRCYCQRGYRLHNDNRTCVDVDECAEFAAASPRSRGRLCAGECVNTAGSYRCACPKGYRLSEDGRSCVDIDECENRLATCATEYDEVCSNTRGGYHCHRINCPLGYRLESKHRCSRIQRSCLINDMDCLHQPSSYSYNFITFVSNIYLPMGSVDLFTMHGPSWSDSMFNFELGMISSQSQSPTVQPADLSCFDIRPTNNICVVSLLCSLPGPQVIELELKMSLYQRDVFAGTAVARLVVIVSEYDY